MRVALSVTPRRLASLVVIIAASLYAGIALAQQGSMKGALNAQGSAQIVQGPVAIPPTVSISPSTANLATSATQAFTATVLHDNFSQGVIWTLSGVGCSGSTCGTVSAPFSKSGVPVTYTAPASAPNPNLVVLMATAVTSPTHASSATVNITITVPPPPIVVRNTCVPGSQTTTALNTFSCQASLGNAVEVTIYNGPTTTVTGVNAVTAAHVSIPLTRVCSPSNVCIATSGGVSIQKWYGIGLPAGISTYTVSNNPATSLTGIAVMDLSNIIALDTANFTGSVTVPTTGPIGPIVTTTAADIIIPSIGVTGATTGIASPFTNVPGVVFGNGLAYSIQSLAGTFNPNWTTTSGTWAGVTSAYIGGIPTPVITVTVAPTTASVKVNTTATFTPTVTNDSQGVTLTLTGSGCSGSTCGTLSSSTVASGVAVTYTAPPIVPSPATVTLTAASITNPAKTATATITITSNPIIISVSPGTASVQTLATQTFSCTLTNDGANAGCDWTLTGAGCSGATCGTISTSHTASGATLTYTGPSTVPSPATVTLTVASTTDNTKTAAVTITLFAPPAIVVSVSPGSSNVQTSAVKAFSCTVTNDPAAGGCDWALSGAGCSGSTCGTVSTTHTASGVTLNYTGPGSVPSPATVSLTATSTTDNTKSAVATITVVAAPVLTVVIAPGSANVQTGLTQSFTPTVTNDGSNLGVDWTLTCTGSCGVLSLAHTASGVATVYTAPVTVPSPATVTIKATSTTDNTKSASSVITVFSLPITVTIAPGTANVPVNETAAFTPTVTNDPALGGVDWTLSGSCTAFSEAFNEGTLPAIWAPTTATGVEGGGSFSPSHISLSQGVLQMSVTQDGTTAGSVGAEIELNRKFGYGTYSWSMQAAGTSATQGGAGSAVRGQISSTFQYASGANPVPTEIDAPEIEGQFPNQIEYTTWTNGVVADEHQVTLSNPQNTYHVYKYIWAPGSITFYLDGTLVWTTTNNVPTAPAFPITNLWGTNNTNFGGLATPGVTRYMYVNNFTYSNCGSLSAAHTASGTPVTYTAPASVPSPATVTITATSTTDNTKSTSSTITVGPPPNITVSVAPSTASVTTGGVTNLTATVANDTSGQGVVWTLTGAGCSGATCGSISPMASASGVAVVYTAPASVPSPATVTATATSVTAPTVSASSTITVTSPVITVTVAPPTATLQVGGQTQAFTANIANSTQGVNWVLSGPTCSGATCGTISATTSLSGVPITYTSPSANVSETVTLTATSIQDGTKTSSATIHVNANTTQPSCANTPCPAFLGTGVNGNASAQGGGAGTAGGRGGKVYEVTTLGDANGACTATAVGYTNCSFRQVYNDVNGAGCRYVIFRIAGVFPATMGDLRTSAPCMTIEGQSAPGEVILGGPSTTGALGGISTHDIILRYLTYSPDNITQASGPDSGTTSIWIVNCSSITQALSLATPPPTTSGCYNIIDDHVTKRWSGNKSWITTSNFTPTATQAGVGPNHSITSQWGLMYEPSQGHPVGYGTATDESCQSLASNGHCLSSFETDIDFHHNILINVDHRIPEIGNKSSRWTNNITYNWSTYAVQELGAMSLDVINNKFITGPQSGSIQAHPVHWTANGPEICGPPSGYMSGNIFGPPGTNTVDGNQWGDLAIAIAGEDATAENSVLTPVAPNGTINEWCLAPVSLGGGGQPQTSGVPVPSGWQRTSPMAASNAFPIIPDPATSLDTVLVPFAGNYAHLDGLGNWVSHRDPQDTRVTNQYKNGAAGGFYPNDVTYSGVCWTGVTPQCANPTLPLPTVQPNWTDTPVTNFPLQVESLHDGIPDTWKQKYGLSTSDTTLYKRTDSTTGLPYIEDYYDGLVPGGGQPLLNSLTPSQKNVSQAGIDWSVTGLPSGPPDAAWTQCGATIQAASFGNGATDATSAINSAIAACGTSQYVLLGPGTFLFNSSGAGSPQLKVGKSNVVLRGSGASQTILNSTGTNGACTSAPCEGWIALGTNANPSVANDVAITAGSTAGSTSITVTSATNFAIGNLVVITELNETTGYSPYVGPTPPNPTPGDAGGCTYCDNLWGGTRDRSQIVEVTSVNGTTIGISPPLYTAYTLTPHALPFVPVRNSGVENLQIVGNNTHPNGNSGATGQIALTQCAYCWIKGVEFNYPDGDYLMALWTFRSDITANYMTNGFNHITGTNNNAIHLTDKSSANRVYNNIIERGQNAYQYDIGASGNVYAYNYDTGDFGAPTTVRNITGEYSHSAHGQFQLFEGNIGAFNDYDVLHGTQSENTDFRNWWVGTSFICNPQNNTRGTVSGCAWGTGDPTGIFVGSLATTTNIIGDVVGSVAQTGLGGAVAVLQWPSTRGYTTPYGVTWGYSTGGDTGGNSFDSTLPFSTGFVHGLYNNVDGSTTWSSVVARTLPSSLYLNGKPSWWGAQPWPGIGPDITGGTLPSGQGAGSPPGGHVNSNPAMTCFYTTMGGAEGGVGSPLTFNPVTCYGP